jgi:hypothetical protein
MNKIFVMKISLGNINSRLGIAEEKIIELENAAMELSKREQREIKYWKQ